MQRATYVIEKAEVRLNMRSIFSRPYDEDYAKLCIEKAFPNLKWDLVRQENDPPDLADYRNNIGVEVVRAIEQKTAQIQSEYEKYCEKSEAIDIKEKLERITNNSKSRLAHDLNDNIIGLVCVTGEEQYTLIKEMIIKKTKILNKQNYPAYDEDCLFVYNSGGYCPNIKIYEVMSAVKNETKVYCRHFKKIIIYCDHKVFLYDASNNSIECACISTIEIETMKENVLKKLGRETEYREGKAFLRE